MATKWKFTTSKRNAVSRTNEDGSQDCYTVDHPEIQAWIAAGNTPDEPNDLTETAI